MKYLNEIEDVFDIEGRGCIIAPGIPFTVDPPVTVGDEVEIHNPNGKIIVTKIKGIAMLNRGKPMNAAPFTVNGKIKKSDIELGAKLYLK